MVKNLLTVQETCVQLPGWEDPLAKGMATHSNILALKIPWTEELGAGYYPDQIRSDQSLSRVQLFATP